MLYYNVNTIRNTVLTAVVLQPPRVNEIVSYIMIFVNYNICC